MRLVIKEKKLWNMIALFLVCVLCLKEVKIVKASYATWPYCLKTEAKAIAVIDVETGTIVMGKNLYEKRYPASITKVLTALVVLEHYKSMDEMVTFTKEAIRMEDLESKTLWLAEGERLSMRDCLHGLMLESANDVAKGLAIHIAGSVEEFAKLMNEKAESLGCTQSHFMNPHGLFHENHYICAADMAKIARAAAKNPRFREIAGTVRYTIPKTNKFKYRRFLTNNSKMLLPKSPFYYDKCYGAKNGYIDEARITYVAMAEKEDLKFAVVMLGANTKETEYKGTEKLFEFCFDYFKPVDAKDLSLTVPRKEGDLFSKIQKKDTKAKIHVEKGIRLILPKGYDSKKLSAEVVYQKRKKIQAGFNQIGRILYHYEGKTVGEGNVYYVSYNEYFLD